MTRRIAFAGAALLVAAAVGYLLLARTPSGAGWTYRRWNAPGFAGPPATSTLVSEPIELERPTTPFSAEWTAWLRIDEADLYEFTAEADDSILLAVDGQSIIQFEGASTRTKRVGTIRLARGVYPVSLRLQDFGGGKFLRLYLRGLDGPRGWMPLPWPRETAWPTRALAEVAPAPLPPLARAWLFGACLIAACLGGALLVRGRAVARGRKVMPRHDLLIAAALTLMAFGIRGWNIDRADIYWDEGAYLKAGMHYVRNVEVLDLSAGSFAWNSEHPPVAKWMFGLAERAGGMLGAKLFCAGLYALTALLVFLMGRRWMSRRVAVSAAFLVATSPYSLGHGQAVGLESAVVFFFALSTWLLLLACERASWRLHMAWGFTSILGVGSKAIGVWFAPLALVVCAASWLRGSRRLRPYLAAILGVVLGLLAIYAVWPWVWPGIVAQLRTTMAHWQGPISTEFVFGADRRPPVWYYAFAFVVQNPTGLLLMGLVGAVFALKRRTLLDLALLGWLVFPFGQSLPSLRQDASRYVIQSFPALAFLAAVGMEAVVGRFKRQGIAWFGHAALAAYVAFAAIRIYPHGIDYCAEWAGGEAGVIRRRWLEIPFWGEGHQELAAAINRLVPQGATLHLKTMPHDDFPKIRPDIARAPVESASYLAMNFFRFQTPPKGWRAIHVVRAGSGEIAALYERIPAP